MYLSIQIHLFTKISALIVREIDNVNKFALITTAFIKPDFKSDYLFRTCSVATNLVTSLYYSLYLLCDYAVPRWPVMVLLRIYSFSLSYGTCSATTEYGTVPQRIGHTRNQLIQIRNGLGRLLSTA